MATKASRFPKFHFFFLFLYSSIKYFLIFNADKLLKKANVFDPYALIINWIIIYFVVFEPFKFFSIEFFAKCTFHLNVVQHLSCQKSK